MADLKGELIKEVEIKSSPDKFYNFWKTPHHLPNVSNGHVQEVDVHDGDWDTHGHGSIKTWKYTPEEGVSEIFKELVELDDENKSMTMVGIEGHVFERYKSIKVIYHALPKSNGEEGSIIKLRIEYEKLNVDVPIPNQYLNMIINVTKDIDAYLCNNDAN